MNNVATIIESKADLFIIKKKKKKKILKMLNQTENKTERIIKFFQFLQYFISLIDIEQETCYLYFVNFCFI